MKLRVKTLFLLIIFLSSCTAVGVYVDSALDGSLFDDPKIKSGEFPFHLQYSLEGEIYDVTDTQLCSYEGKQINGGGASNIWRTELASGKEEVILKHINESEYIYFPIGSCKTYMDDWEGHESINLHAMDGAALAFISEGYRSYEFIPASELERTYEIIIIEWDPAEPLRQPEN